MQPILEITSEDGIKYDIYPYQATLENLKFLWDKLQDFKQLFSDYTAGDFDNFIKVVTSKDSVFVVAARGSDPIGILYADRIRPGFDAGAHFLFWDYRVKGKSKVVINTLKWLMDEYGLHRVNIETPKTKATVPLRRALKWMHIPYEGTRRRALRQEGEMQDMLLFGVLREELTPDALDSGRLAEEITSAPQQVAT